MKSVRFFVTAATCLTLSASTLSVCAHAAPSVDIIPAKGGPIRITAKFHASTQIEYRGKVIVVDPVSAASWTKKADFILITHPHGDHLDLPAIAKLDTAATMILAPAEVAKNISTPRSAAHAISPVGAMRMTSLDFPLISVSAVPAYNLARGPKPGQKFHTKESQWNGYIITIGGKRLYFAGDTEATPEMKALKDIDAAFLPMNLPYTMTPQEAAAAVRAFKPKRVYPYHFRYPFDKDSGNERTFAALLRGSGTKVKILDWYPKAALAKVAAASKK
ncbi:MAG TPA: MBL fold metallo-hydrolase [Abditibacteriaceae bacterium]|jgi:L-ascorbate metabolism protein UlaG (beta-lactamase superfamily)